MWYFPYWAVESHVVTDVIEDLDEYSENVGYLKWATTSLLSMISTINNVE